MPAQKPFSPLQSLTVGKHLSPAQQSGLRSDGILSNEQSTTSSAEISGLRGAAESLTPSSHPDLAYVLEISVHGTLTVIG